MRVKQFTPKQIVQMALDASSFEPGPVEVLSLHFGRGYTLRFQRDTAKKHGGHPVSQSAAGNLFSFASLEAAKAWFKEVCGHEPEIHVNHHGDNYSVWLWTRFTRPPYLSAKIYPRPHGTRS